VEVPSASPARTELAGDTDVESNLHSGFGTTVAARRPRAVIGGGPEAALQQAGSPEGPAIRGWRDLRPVLRSM
jgi:hypothetical protein